MKNKLLFLFLIFILFSFSSCKKKGEEIPPKPDGGDDSGGSEIVDPETKDPLTASLDKEYYVTSEDIKLTINNANSPTITCSNPNAVSVVNETTLKAKRVGDFTLTIQDGEELVELPLKIYSRQLSISTTTDVIAVGDKIEVWFNNFENLHETSEDDFTYTSSDESVAVVDGQIFTALKIGDFLVEVTSKENPLVKAEYKIEVRDPATTFMLRPAKELGHIKVGEILPIELTDGQDPADFSWGNSYKEILRVTKYDTSVEVTGIGEGVASFTCYNVENPQINGHYFIKVKDVADIDYIDRLVNLAFSQVGVRENGDNVQKYGEWYGNNGNPWCATFVSWCWFHSGLSNTILLKYQGCSAGKQWCEEQKIFHYKEEAGFEPQSGDIIFFLSSGMSHTGIVGYADDEYIYTIEGNRSNCVGVWRISKNNRTITGYARPAYPETSKTHDFSWLARNKGDGTYYWVQVTSGEPTV